MIKDRGGDFTRKATVLACGGCCCCCCLQAGVAGYYFGKATHETIRDAFGMLGIAGKVAAFIAPLIVAGVALTLPGHGAVESANMTALALAFFSPLVLAALGITFWLGAALGTIFDLVLGHGKYAMHGLGELGLIVLWASMRSVAFGAIACIVSIPLMMLFMTSAAWAVVPPLIVIASFSGWRSIHD